MWGHWERTSRSSFGMIIYISIFVVSLVQSMRVQSYFNTRIKNRLLSVKPPSRFSFSTRKTSFNLQEKPDFEAEKDIKYFEFQRLEKSIYKWWESSGYFKPENIDSVDISTKKKPYVIPMPPPNVTGYLHMGHAIFIALQDILARFHRMRGRDTLYVPGTDHAGIATQLLVEREINKLGTTRQELGREKFLEKVWEWKNEKGTYIVGQMKRLGATADWSKEKFTLEPQMSDAVTEAFIRMHEKGLIYKGDYMVNWSPNLQTAVSDLEVDYVEEMGKLYYFKYVLDGSHDESKYIPVATTRPETILGDTAVCVHPDDIRYKEFIGQMVKVPMTNRIIPVIADEYVDQSFGTGALKITPAHDINDYELGKKHQLPFLTIMNKDGSMNGIGEVDPSGQPPSDWQLKYKGLDRFVCREKIWNDMTTENLTIKVEPHMQRIPRSQRGGEIIEPLVSSQWFVKMDDMARRAIDAVKSKEITIYPERFEKVWYNWLENIRDWCISRQLWWGHRIPVYYIQGETIPAGEYVVARDMNDAQDKVAKKFGTVKGLKIDQDEDVLDTWFSSGLWPFATLGWPESNGLLTRFYPATVLETGYDILFFWVARMVMMGFELTDQSPFEVIYLHGLVRDGQGQKMSKTKGNVIDPIDTIDSFGCDALRYSLVTGSTPGQDIPLSMEKIETSRNFVNKLWNSGKYITNCLSDLSVEERNALGFIPPYDANDIANLPLPEQYIISRCHQLVNEVTNGLESYSFSEPGRLIYEFLWDEFADWYIEASKVRMRNSVDKAMARRVLVYVWSTCLKLLHPFMPFLTESLYQLIPHSQDSIMMSPWPLLDTSQPLAIDKEAIQLFQTFQTLVRNIRNARAEYNVDVGKKLEGVQIRSSSAKFRSFVETEKTIFSMLSRLDESSLTFIEDRGHLESSSSVAYVHLVVEDGVEVFIPQSGLIDKQKEQMRLNKQAEKLRKDIQVLSGRLSNQGFIDRAPESVVKESQMTLREMKEQLIVVENSLLELSKV